MLRRSRPVSFKPVPYQRARSPFRVPGWLITLLIGAALGVGGVLYVQQRYLPPTLSAEESQRLIAELADANQQRQRLAADLEQTVGQLQAARSELATAGSELTSARERVARLQQDASQFFEALAPDPRGGPIGIRSARFEAADSRLSYNILFTDDRSPQQAFRGVMQLVVAGRRGSGGEDTVTIDPVPLSVDAHQHLQGSAVLPTGFVPTQATIRVLDREGGPQLSMRVYNVR
jgi:hypothetical protein